jgi:hypothetical protein
MNKTSKNITTIETTGSTKKAFIIHNPFLALLVLILALLTPFATLWALNTLFHLNAAYSFINWLATVILIITLQSAIKIRNK